MHTLKRTLGVLLLVLLAAGTLWALADSKNVTILFNAEWQPDEDIPGGGVIVGRGEGSNGIISIDLPMPPPDEAGEDPIQLTAENVTYMSITVVDDQGATREFNEGHIQKINYDIIFDYEWDNGVTQQYQVTHTVE